MKRATGQHTPAPWKAVQAQDGRAPLVSIVADGHEFQEGEIWPYQPRIGAAYHGRGEAPQEVAKANALLMAASPDLLAACKAMLAEVYEAERNGNPCCISANACEAARVAISKAECAGSHKNV